ncbi:hypothetical protein BFP76_00015 [Amylibacter kogurei]|uniref:DUF7507 domain-containing protein n=1 Tax=Paramylibacter kogurei TaxID=1889778 RepID=A0A2G5K7R5_9RHOB|nr:hypothetical protein [Amylibacter kogurei]PIB25568.1 hypothetical protein BFP76_00015 [Amylibacter kogurei]
MINVFTLLGLCIFAGVTLLKDKILISLKNLIGFQRSTDQNALVGCFLPLVLLTYLAGASSLHAQEQSGNWNAFGDYTFSNGTTADVSGIGFTDGNFENLTVWSESLANDISLENVYTPDECRTFSFTSGGVPKAQTNPVIHIDRIGGLIDGVANAANITLSGTDVVTGNALTWTRLSGTVDFAVTPTTATDQSAIDGTANTTGTSGDDMETTASGSVRIDGTTATFQLCFPIIGPSGNDGIEFILFADPSDPELSVVKETTTIPSFAGQTLDYTFTVTNSGNAAASGLNITDSKCATVINLDSGDLNGNAFLEPTETWIYSCTSIPVTPLEVLAGEVVNTVTVQYDDPTGNAEPDAQTTLTTPIVPVVLVAQDDTIPSIAGLVGGSSTVSVLDNDSVNGASVH